MLHRIASIAALLLSIHVSAQEYNFQSVENAASAAGTVLAAPVDTTQASNHIQHRIRSGEVQSRGVNLGSWLVAEKWMTNEADIWHDAPEQVAAGGEFQVMRHGDDSGRRRARFEDHHNTFIMEKEIEAIAKAGLNTVRVPVGYWITGEDPFDVSNLQELKTYPNGTATYLDRLIKEWAVTHNVAVLVSIHAAKGSQNGADHSAPTDSGKTYWSKFKENVDNTIYVAEWLAKRYKDEPAFLGIGLLNEPNGDTDENVLNQYYLDAYKAVRATGSDCVLTIMPLLFKQDATNLNGFMEAPAYTNVWVEWHPYFIWGYDKVSPEDLISKSILTDYQSKVQQWNTRVNANKLYFGEWCFANTGQFPDADSDAFRRWAQAQMTVMIQATGGWAYWSWRKYGDDHPGAFEAWSMRSVLSKEPLAKILNGST